MFCFILRIITDRKPLVAEGGVEPPALGYEPNKLPLLYSAIVLGMLKHPNKNYKFELNTNAVILFTNRIIMYTTVSL